MTVDSPCVQVCQVSRDNAVCTGCYRSLAEIAKWSGLSDAEKMQIIAAAAQRRTNLTGQQYSEELP
jgi:predicted Fe-S protein YdhL (DUF1289 family)